MVLRLSRKNSLKWSGKWSGNGLKMVWKMVYNIVLPSTCQLYPYCSSSLPLFLPLHIHSLLVYIRLSFSLYLIHAVSLSLYALSHFSLNHFYVSFFFFSFFFFFFFFSSLSYFIKWNVYFDSLFIYISSERNNIVLTRLLILSFFN